MRCTGPLGYAVGGSAVLALLAGCSGGGGSSSPTPLAPQGSQAQAAFRAVSSFARQSPQQLSSVLRPGVSRSGRPDRSAGFADPDAALTAAIIVSDAIANAAFVYDRMGKPAAKITGLNQPQGIAADPTGDLYIANTLDSNIPVYKDDYKTLKTKLTDPGQYPAGVAVDAKTGVVGVTNIVSTSGGAGSVSFYAKAATKPCVTVKNAKWARIYFGAFDAIGDFYVDGQDASGSALVGVVKGGCSAKAISPLTTANTIAFPGAVQVGPAGNIMIDDQAGSTIFTYAPPAKGALGAPIKTTKLKGASDPVTFSLLKSTADVYAADAGLAAALKYKFPDGGAALESIGGFQQPIGVVVTPVEQP